LYGVPPFHADTPSEVFENILLRRIDWAEDVVEISPEARDLMERLMCTDYEIRLGTNGAAEVKAHPWFSDIVWDDVINEEASFVPKLAGIDDTTYFDDRGAAEKRLEEPEIEEGGSVEDIVKSAESIERAKSEISLSESAPDFGDFVYRNLELLERANNDVVRKLRAETKSEGSRARHRSLPAGAMAATTAALKNLTLDEQQDRLNVPKSHHLSVTESLPAVVPPSAPPVPQLDSLKPKRGHLESTHARRNSMPTRFKILTASSSSDMMAQQVESPVSTSRLRSESAALPQSQPPSPSRAAQRPPVSRPVEKPKNETAAMIMNAMGRPMDVLIADDNPVSCKILDKMLTLLGCRCVMVRNGAEAIRCALGDVKFDVIFMDIRMPIGE